MTIAMRIMLPGAVLVSALAFSSPALGVSENNCRTICTLTAEPGGAQVCIEQVPCAKYRGQTEISAAAVRRIAAAAKARKRNAGSSNSAYELCAPGGSASGSARSVL